MAGANPLTVPIGSRITITVVGKIGSQIYTMGGMTTHLNLLADEPGDYPGFSANFSGDGFSDMRFIAKAVPADDFEGWVAQVRGTGSALDDAGYAELAKPTRAVPPMTYRAVAPQLFERIVAQTASGPEEAGAGRGRTRRRLRCWAG